MISYQIKITIGDYVDELLFEMEAKYIIKKWVIF